MPRILVYLLFVVCLAAVPLNVAAVTLKIATVAPEGSQWMIQMRAGASAIKERTAGRVRLKFYGGGVMGNEKSVLRKIRMGQLQGGAFTCSGLGRIDPDAGFYGVPLLTSSEQEMHYLRQQMDADIAAVLGKSGFVSFGFAAGGFANLMSKVPISGVDDLKGKKIWVPEGDRVSYAVMESLGLAPVTLPLSDVLTGLQTGLVEVVGASPLGALAFQWYTRIDYITPLPLVYIYGALVIDKRKFERLAPPDQAVVTEVLSAMYREFDRQNIIDNNEALQVLQKEGLQIIQPLPGEYERWNVVAGKAINEMVQRKLFSAALYDKIQTTLHEYRHLQQDKM